MSTYLVSRPGRPLHLPVWIGGAVAQPLCDQFTFSGRITGRARLVVSDEFGWDRLRQTDCCHRCLVRFRQMRDAIDLVADLPRGGKR